MTTNNTNISNINNSTTNNSNNDSNMEANLASLAEGIKHVEYSMSGDIEETNDGTASIVNLVEAQVALIKGAFPHISNEIAWTVLQALEAGEEVSVKEADIELVNLTPHKLVIHTDDFSEVEELEPEKVSARLTVETVKTGEMRGLSLSKTTLGEVTGLPSQEPGVIFVTSAMVAAKVKREDVVSPGQLLRGKDGQPFGCLGLTKHV
jgi:hypothetical protein